MTTLSVSPKNVIQCNEEMAGKFSSQRGIDWESILRELDYTYFLHLSYQNTVDRKMCDYFMYILSINSACSIAQIDWFVFTRKRGDLKFDQLFPQNLFTFTSLLPVYQEPHRIVDYWLNFDGVSVISVVIQ